MTGVSPHGTGFERHRKITRRERILRVYCLGHWYNLSDPALEEVLHNIEPMHRFLDIDPGRKAASDDITICKFRRLLVANDLGAALFAEITANLADGGVEVSGGTIVDATIIDAPSSTENRCAERDQ